MENKFDILGEELLSLLEEKYAKPDKSIKKHTEELLETLELLLELGYLKNDKIYELVKIACIYHDIGKINEQFQKRVTGKNLKFNKEKEVAHNVLSIFFINKENFKEEKDYLKVLYAVLNHHDYGDVFEILRDRYDLIKELVSGYKTYKLKKSIKSKLVTPDFINDSESIKIKGYLHKCDYSASSGVIAEYPNDFLCKSLDDLLNSWKIDNNKAQWNKLQEFCLENRDENIIAIAQTGMGKTEGGLLWIGDTKGFFVLPIRTAINAIYDRVRVDLLKNQKIDKRVAILHSSSYEYYLNNLKKDVEKLENIELHSYHQIGKQLSIPLNITTMDQIFDFVYKYPCYELKLTTLGYSKIVIDEIQAYSADLLAYLVYGLERVVEQGGKVAILTATLPPFIKDLLKKNINFKENSEPFTDESKRHNLKVKEDRINSKDIIEKYKFNKDLGKANKVLVVCNTIKDAQRIYLKLKDSDIISNEDLHILHSKFIRAERLEKEKEIIKFGQTFDESGNIDIQNGIWISTSIVEASLDIDFDYLFTELQELNSLFQRLGRCNRKGVKDSTEYNCYIYSEISENLLIDGEKGFIDKDLYRLSKEAIKDIDGQISEISKVELIERYLNTDNMRNSSFMRKYRKIYGEITDLIPSTFNKKDVDLRNILSTDIIPGSIYEKYYEDIKELENKLQSVDLDKEKRLELKDKIRKYTVSVEPWQVDKYERARNNGRALSYPNISLSYNSKEIIKVIECEYSEIGFVSKKFDKNTRDAVMI